MEQSSPLEEAAQGPSVTTRRAVLAGAGAAAVVVLAGCATYDQNAPPAGDPGGDPGTDPAPGGQTDDPGDSGVSAALTQTSEIPVGGGTVFDQDRVVITQPQAGTFKAFSAVCTHQGCLVAEVRSGKILCPCHASAFKVADGSVASGPATRALKAVAIKVEGTDIRLV